MIKKCPKCQATKPIASFSADRTKASGRKSHCRECFAEKERARASARSAAADARDDKVIAAEQARASRLASDIDPLRPEDFDNPDDEYDVSVANNGKDRKLSAQASREKRQEFTRAMGDNAEALKGAAASAHTRDGDILSAMPGASGAYIAKLAEGERRFGNRRLARSISLAQAQEALALQTYKAVAARYFSSKITATGFARRAPSAPAKRSTVLLLSDLHIGADLDSLDEPMPFRAVEEARRLEFILRQTIEYKTQYRKNTKLVLLFNGDVIEGQLMHDFRSGAPLAEQKAIFWMYFRQFIAELSAAFPEVEIHWQSGNHGRDKVRHPGRATSRKWDGHEFEIGFALRMMCADLRNVTWHMPFRAVSIVDLHGKNLLVTHADTEVKMQHPDRHEANIGQLHKINNNRTWGVVFDAAAFGHYHSGRFIPGAPSIVWNGALVPPNGHARASGYIGEACGQFLWEAVEGFPVGDVRFLHVGPAQDNDERLGTLIKPFRFAGV